MTPEAIQVGNGAYVRIKHSSLELGSGGTPAAISSATAELHDREANPIAGASINLSDDGNGDFEGVIDKSHFEVGKRYWIKANVTLADGVDGEDWTFITISRGG